MSFGIRPDHCQALGYIENSLNPMLCLQQDFWSIHPEKQPRDRPSKNTKKKLFEQSDFRVDWLPKFDCVQPSESDTRPFWTCCKSTASHVSASPLWFQTQFYRGRCTMFEGDSIPSWEGRHVKLPVVQQQVEQIDFTNGPGRPLEPPLWSFVSVSSATHFSKWDSVCFWLSLFHFVKKETQNCNPVPVQSSQFLVNVVSFNGYSSVVCLGEIRCDASNIQGRK